MTLTLPHKQAPEEWDLKEKQTHQMSLLTSLPEGATWQYAQQDLQSHGYSSDHLPICISDPAGQW